MNTTNLVVLKGSIPLKCGHDTFQPNSFYRCLTPTENESDSYLIYGNQVSYINFDKYFEFAHNRVMREWEALGLIVNDKPITKKRFLELADVYAYGKRRALYFRNEEIVYAFNLGETTLTHARNIAYNVYLDFLNGNTVYLDSGSIQCGNKGIPLTYGGLNFHKNNLVDLKLVLSLT